MGLSIDKKQAATIVVATVVAAVIIFLLNKWLVKKVTTANGETASFVGHPSVGYI
ncbi:hypothetical protein [Pedobacter jeongneungensis]|uniref:hypothetical protein n=1 Tax=Pedobacter TaxID=84567 RepID=UPI000A7D7A80|nr:hypothetical protein [Pedobacter jeongneungensis]